MLSLSTLPPLSLYIHYPWCVKKCPYCDFNSHQARDTIPEKEYITALIENLTEQLPRVWGRRLHSIFIGGGTPSLLSAKGMDYLLSQIRALIPLQPDAEVTLEANPGTAEALKFEGFRDAGINRLSIGVQSFDDKHLTKLGRIHSANDALKAIEMAQNAGFERINVDLMHGLPQQNISQATNDLAIAFSTGVTHLSWYQLTLEPNTLFYQQPPKLPEDDLLTDIQDAGEKILIENGYKQYEISAYAKHENLRSNHNLNYWQFGDYLAIGAGAHGKLTLPAENRIVRYSQKRHPKDFLNRELPFIASEKNIETSDLPLEFMMNALRLVDGSPQSYFFERTGLNLMHIKREIEKAKVNGLLDDSKNSFKPTLKGRRFLNELLEIFMIESPRFNDAINIKQVD